MYDLDLQWGSVENRLAVSTTEDVYIVSEHVMSLHCCGAVSYLVAAAAYVLRS